MGSCSAALVTHHPHQTLSTFSILAPPFPSLAFLPAESLAPYLCRKTEVAPRQCPVLSSVEVRLTPNPRERPPPPPVPRRHPPDTRDPVPHTTSPRSRLPTNPDPPGPTDRPQAALSPQPPPLPVPRFPSRRVVSWWEMECPASSPPMRGSHSWFCRVPGPLIGSREGEVNTEKT